MSNWFAIAGRRRARAAGRRSTGTPPASSSGPATRRTSSASNRSLPAETGVWMVNTLSRRTSAHACASDRPLCDVLARALGEEERGVALVQVPDRRLEAERPDGAHAADAQHELLVEPHLAAADVQDVGDRPVGGRVLGDVGVEQEDRHAPDLGDPDRGEQVAPGQLDRDRQRQAGRGPGPARAAGATGRSRGSRAPGGRRRRSSGGSSPCDTAARRRSRAAPCRWPTSCGRRRARRDRRSRCRAIRGSRIRRRSRRSGRSACRRICAGTSGRSRWPCRRRTRRGRRGIRRGTSRRRAAAASRRRR